MTDNEPLYDDILEVDPKLLPWIRLSWRAWLLPPLLVIVLAVIVLLAARGFASTTTLGWRVGAVSAIVAALVVLPFGWRAYVEVTGPAVLRYRRSVAIGYVGLGIILLVTGVLTNNTFLASIIIYQLLPLLGRLRSRIVKRAERDPARGRRIVTFTFVATIAVILGAGGLVLFGPGGFAATYVASNVFIYGVVTAVGAAVTLREIDRLPGAGG